MEDHQRKFEQRIQKIEAAIKAVDDTLKQPRDQRKSHETDAYLADEKMDLETELAAERSLQALEPQSPPGGLWVA